MEVKEHIESAPPRPPPKSAQLQQLESALQSAETHLAMLKGGFAHNAAAIRNQERIVAQYKARIAELKGIDSWPI